MRRPLLVLPLLPLFAACAPEATPCDEPDAGVGSPPADRLDLSFRCVIEVDDAGNVNLGSCDDLTFEVALDDGTVLTYTGPEQVRVSFDAGYDGGKQVFVGLSGVDPAQALVDGAAPTAYLFVPRDDFAVGEIALADVLSNEPCHGDGTCASVGLHAHDLERNAYLYDLGATPGGSLQVTAGGTAVGDTVELSITGLPFSYANPWWEDAVVCDDGLIHYRG